MLSKSLTQFSVDGRDCVPSLLVVWPEVTQGSDRMWSTGEGNGKPLQYSCLENPMSSMKMALHRSHITNW